MTNQVLQPDFSFRRDSCRNCRLENLKITKKESMASLTETVELRIQNICSDNLSGSWTSHASQIKVQKIEGGLSNYLYVCSLPEHIKLSGNEPIKVLVRIYGEVIKSSEDFLIKDSILFAILSERKIGPPMLGLFSGGRIEAYIESRPLKTDELCDPNIAMHIARHMKIVHEIKMPIPKDPLKFYKQIDKWISRLSPDNDNASEESGIILFKATNYNSPENIFLEYQIEKELDWIRNTVLHNNLMKSPVVFCHNDMQENNILYIGSPTAQDGFQLQLIDFEYSAYNFRAFDIGNHMCESLWDYVVTGPPGFKYKPENYPTRERQLLFWKYYLGEDYLQHNEESLLREITYGMLLSDFFWGVWSLFQSQVSSIKFGFIECAKARLLSYQQNKDKVLQFD